MDPVSGTMDALRRLVRALRLSARGVEKAYGISSAQLFVLQQLSEVPSASLGELAALTATDPSSVSVVVARLVERGFVDRKAADSDARRAELRLTGEGRRLLRRAPAPPPQERLIEAVRGLPPGQLSLLRKSLESLVEAVGAERERPEMFFENETPRRRRGRRG